jgi:chromosome segregation ATPase
MNTTNLENEIMKYQSQILDLKSEVTHLTTDLAQARREVEVANRKLETARQQIADLSNERDQAHADAAVMRGALEFYAKRGQIARLALETTNAGADLLCRYREAVELVKSAPNDLSYGLGHRDMYEADKQVSNKWLLRRDSLLATVKGDL